MSVITVSHSRGQYPVYVERGLLLTLPALVASELPARRLAVVTDETVAPLYDKWTRDATPLPVAVRLTIPPGEASKTRDSWSRLSDALLAAHFGRDSALLALGGGVVGDLAGFVAATYLRGIPVVQVPTTLLAMLDASVGGKVGVDTSQGKNLIGAFHPPVLVVADPLTLLTLPERAYRAGLAEAVKHGLIADLDYFEWIEAHTVELGQRNLDVLTELVRQSVEIKAAVVGEDERETGRRATLNAGHTIGHAMEQESAYRVEHGEAVALGLIAESQIAERLGLAPAGVSERVAVLLQSLGLRRRLRVPLDRGRLLATMLHDKKNRGGQIRLALPSGIGAMHAGEGGWTIPVDAALIDEAVAAVS